MKPRKLEWIVQQLDTFSIPKIKLEQYSTSPELAVAIVNAIDTEVGGLEEKGLLDLGCGCGILMTAAAAGCEPAFCMGVDIDEDALAICRKNLEMADVEERCDLIKANALKLDGVLTQKFEVVVTNPPFGTKNNLGTDMKFVQAGLALLKTGGHIFSLHKTSTRDFIIKTANKWNNVELCECVAQLRWNLPATYKFHKKKSVDIDVDLIHCVAK